MKETFKSKLGFAMFFLLIIFLIVGGFFFMKYELRKDKEPPKTKEEKKNHKIDKNKDYIYFENEETISEEAEIYYKDVIINLNTQTVLNETLAKENKIYKNNILRISDVTIPFNEVIKYNYDNIYSLTFRLYETYEFGKYISLVIKDYDYSCFTSVNFNKVKAYVFNVNNGKLLSENDLLNMYGINMDTVKERIKEYLLSKQTKENGIEVIKIDETINDMNNYSLYINEFGKLAISYLVKTTQTDYNEVMEVN